MTETAERRTTPDRRTAPRSKDGSGAHVEAMIEKDSFYAPLPGGILVDHSEVGCCLDFSDSHNLEIGKIILFKVIAGTSLDHKDVTARIIWMVEEGEVIRVGCEFSEHIIGVPFFN